MQYVRTHPPTTILFLFFARVRRRAACRCAPWRATGARRAVRTSPRVGGSSSCGDRTALQSRRERPQQLRPSGERGGPAVYLVCRLCTSSGKTADSLTRATELLHPPLPLPPRRPAEWRTRDGRRAGDGLRSGAGAPSPTNNLCPPAPQCAESLRLFFLPHDGHTTHVWPGARRQPTS